MSIQKHLLRLGLRINRSDLEVGECGEYRWRIHGVDKYVFCAGLENTALMWMDRTGKIVPDSNGSPYAGTNNAPSARMSWVKGWVGKFKSEHDVMVCPRWDDPLEVWKDYVDGHTAPYRQGFFPGIHAVITSPSRRIIDPFPHSCRCGSKAYVGFMRVECSRKDCPGFPL